MIKALRTANNAYDEKITFVYVDWDLHRRAPISKQLKIWRQSSLVLLKGDSELGRLVAQTSTASIQGLLDKAL
ncbi:MAG: hypothetical protein HOB72_07550 [Rhodospirillaceae bacterium]|nr:hypothetical protein [Rhodospirillaceae bacterium]